MRLKSLLEGRVIPFKRKARSLSTDMDLDRPEHSREKYQLNFELLIDWMKEVKQDFRTPMMRGLDNIINRLTVEIGYPHVNIENLDQFDQTDRAFILSVKQNKARIIRLLREIQVKVSDFAVNLPAVNPVARNIKHLLEEYEMYIELFEAL